MAAFFSGVSDGQQGGIRCVAVLLVDSRVGAKDDAVGFECAGSPRHLDEEVAEGQEALTGDGLGRDG